MLSSCLLLLHTHIHKRVHKPAQLKTLTFSLTESGIGLQNLILDTRIVVTIKIVIGSQRAPRVIPELMFFQAEEMSDFGL